MILCVVGPTGVGKTKLSVELALKYNAIIINADAMQVYKGLDIGTAKVREDKKKGVPHYLFDIKDLDEEYTVYDYQKDVRELLKKYKDRNIVFVGGTGLYLKAALYDYRFVDEEKKVRDYTGYSDEELYEMAKKKDPNVEIHPNNRVRLERFLNKEMQEKVEPVMLYPHLIIGLTTERAVLYERINKRVDVMVRDGLLLEARKFYDAGVRTKPLLCGIGYKELYAYFDGKDTLEDALDKVKQNSRHYAKRQYTFFNRQLDVKWFDVDFEDFDKTVQDVIRYIEMERKND